MWSNIISPGVEDNRTIHLGMPPRRLVSFSCTSRLPEDSTLFPCSCAWGAPQSMEWIASSTKNLSESWRSVDAAFTRALLAVSSFFESFGTFSWYHLYSQSLQSSCMILSLPHSFRPIAWSEVLTRFVHSCDVPQTSEWQVGCQHYTKWIQHCFWRRSPTNLPLPSCFFFVFDGFCDSLCKTKHMVHWMRTLRQCTWDLVGRPNKCATWSTSGLCFVGGRRGSFLVLWCLNYATCFARKGSQSSSDTAFDLWSPSVLLSLRLNACQNIKRTNKCGQPTDWFA